MRFIIKETPIANLLTENEINNLVKDLPKELQKKEITLLKKRLKDTSDISYRISDRVEEKDGFSILETYREDEYRNTMEINRASAEARIKKWADVFTVAASNVIAGNKLSKLQEDRYRYVEEVALGYKASDTTYKEEIGLHTLIDECTPKQYVDSVKAQAAEAKKMKRKFTLRIEAIRRALFKAIDNGFYGIVLNMEPRLYNLSEATTIEEIQNIITDILNVVKTGTPDFVNPDTLSE